MQMGLSDSNKLEAKREATRAKRGFTLIELLIAVAIVGVLSTLALVGYRKVIARARLGEATSMVAAIASAQERYRGEFGSYLNVSGTLGHSGSTTNLCPVPAAKFKKTWSPASCVGGASWTALAVQSAGALNFGYSTTAGLAGAVPVDTVPTSTGAVAWPAASAMTRDWYVITAAADTDGDSKWGTVVGSSWTNDMLVDDND
jgi:prepilin-type N-terminal cleavage/methylation domain-containing protein